jgi:hypothetical protein
MNFRMTKNVENCFYRLFLTLSAGRCSVNDMITDELERI